VTVTTTTVTTAATTPTTRRGDWQGIGALYLVQAAQLALPLLGLPFLARTLGPEAWGKVAAAQGFAMTAGVVVEYGFNLSAVRQVARARESREELRRIFSAVLTVQLLCYLAVCLLAGVLRSSIQLFSEDGLLLAAALLWMAPQVISLQWYFQGIEKMATLSGWILAGRCAGLAAMFCLVKGPSDASLSLALQGAGGVLALGAAGWQPFVQLRPRPADWPEVWQTLRQGFNLCCYRAGVALQGTGNAFILALLLSPVAAGAYAGAERLTRAALGVFEPLLVTAFPRVAFLRGRGRDREARDLDRLGTAGIALVGLALGAVLWIIGPWLAATLLGDSYGESGEVIRRLALWPLANALCQMRGLNGLVAAGRDRELTLTALAFGLLQILGLLSSGGINPEGRLQCAAAWMVGTQFLLWLWLEWRTRRRL
jgi:polysaccharide transporter, PST family